MAQTQTKPDRPTWTFTDRLVKARKHADMNGEQLAALLGINLKTLQRYELGYAVPKRGVMLGWALACGVDADWLEHGEHPEDGEGGVSTAVPLRSLRGISTDNARWLAPVAA